jgi:HEAT repeat protein
MNGTRYLAPVTEADVTACIDRLLSGDASARAKAASELARLGIWARGSLLPRGTLTAAGANELPAPERAESLTRLLSDPDTNVRKEVARALGEWGGEESSRSISERLKTELSEEVRRSCIKALGTIGGPHSVEGLLESLKTGSEALVEDAVEAVEELVTGGRVDDTEPAPRRMVRERPRTTAERARADEIVQSVVQALERVRAESASFSLRSKAEGTLNFLAKEKATHRYRVSAARLQELTSALTEVAAPPDASHVLEEVLAGYAMEALPPADVERVDAHLAACVSCASEAEHMVEAFEPWRGAEGEAALARLRERLLAVNARIAAAPVSVAARENLDEIFGLFRKFADQLSDRLRAEWDAFLGGILQPDQPPDPAATSVFLKALLESALLADSKSPAKKTLDLEIEGGLFGVSVEERERNLILRFDSTSLELEGFAITLEAEGVTLGSKPLEKVPGGLGCEIIITREQREQIPHDASLRARLDPPPGPRKVGDATDPS